MNETLHNYDIYPKVFPCDMPVEVTIKPLGVNHAFTDDEYNIVLIKLDGGTPHDEFGRSDSRQFTVKPDNDGCLRFTAE